MEREQHLDIDSKGKIILTNRINLDPILKDNYLERKEIEKGWTKNKTMQKVCSIPQEVLLHDFDGSMFYHAPTGSPEATIALRRFLERHPEYKCSNARI